MIGGTLYASSVLYGTLLWFAWHETGWATWVLLLLFSMTVMLDGLNRRLKKANETAKDQLDATMLELAEKLKAGIQK